jgi:quinolinate synthase
MIKEKNEDAWVIYPECKIKLKKESGFTIDTEQIKKVVKKIKR